jgi:hypothetical protein
MNEIESNHTSRGSTPLEVIEPSMNNIRRTSDFILEPPISDPASLEELADFLQMPISEIVQYIESGNFRLTMKLEEPDTQFIALDDIWALIQYTMDKEGECMIDLENEAYWELRFYMQAKWRLEHGEPESEHLTPIE